MVQHSLHKTSSVQKLRLWSSHLHFQVSTGCLFLFYTFKLHNTPFAQFLYSSLSSVFCPSARVTSQSKPSNSLKQVLYLLHGSPHSLCIQLLDCLSPKPFNHGLYISKSAQNIDTSSVMFYFPLTMRLPTLFLSLCNLVSPLILLDN